MLMPAISRFMTPQPWTIGRDERLAKARDLMREHGIRHLPVLDGGKLVGILSERDVFLLERYSHIDHHMRVEDAMSVDVYTAGPDDPVDTVVDKMAQQKYGSVVVVNRGEVVEGIFTTVDGMRALADVVRRATA